MKTARDSTDMPRTTGEAKVAKAFGLTGDHWMRHANPLSVWSRFSVLSLIAVAVWSRDWIGWFSLIPIALSILWLYFNPIFFKEPRSTKNWASKGVLGERIWAQRNTVDLPPEFVSPVPNIANAAGGIGMAMLIYGLVELNLPATITGIFITHLAKVWFIDRMVLLFDRMKTTVPEFASWEY